MLFKRWLSGFMLLVFTLVLVPTARADVVNVKAESVILLDADSGKVLYEKESDKRLPPASMTKLMTMVLSFDSLQDGRVKMDEKVVTSENAWRLGGSQIYLEPGEEMTFRDMLFAIALGSANDACVAVAEHLDGSHEAFVELMNQTAKKIGMKNTHFVNAYGLPDPNHYSSARDMATLGRYALNYPRLMDFTSTKEYKLRDGEFHLVNTNKLLWWYKGAKGFKTGWTNEAKYCLVSYVKRGDLALVAAVLGSPEPRGNFRDSMALYNYGFARYTYKSFIKEGDVCGTAVVGEGVSPEVQVVALDNVGSICLKGEEKTATYSKSIDSYINAPIKKGQVIGKAEVFMKGKPVKMVDLVAASSVEKTSGWDFIRKMWGKIILI